MVETDSAAFLNALRTVTSQAPDYLETLVVLHNSGVASRLHDVLDLLNRHDNWVAEKHILQGKIRVLEKANSDNARYNDKLRDALGELATRLNNVHTEVYGSPIPSHTGSSLLTDDLVDESQRLLNQRLPAKRSEELAVQIRQSGSNALIGSQISRHSGPRLQTEEMEVEALVSVSPPVDLLDRAAGGNSPDTPMPTHAPPEGIGRSIGKGKQRDAIDDRNIFTTPPVTTRADNSLSTQPRVIHINGADVSNQGGHAVLTGNSSRPQHSFERQPATAWSSPVSHASGAPPHDLSPISTIQPKSPSGTALRDLIINAPTSQTTSNSHPVSHTGAGHTQNTDSQRTVVASPPRQTLFSASTSMIGSEPEENFPPRAQSPAKEGLYPVLPSLDAVMSAIAPTPSAPAVGTYSYPLTSTPETMSVASGPEVETNSFGLPTPPPRNLPRSGLAAGTAIAHRSSSSQTLPNRPTQSVKAPSPLSDECKVVLRTLRRLIAGQSSDYQHGVSLPDLYAELVSTGISDQNMMIEHLTLLADEGFISHGSEDGVPIFFITESGRDFVS